MSELAPHKISKPYLMGDNRGGNVAPQNIMVRNEMTGETLTSHMATPASEDPSEEVNLHGAFQVRKLKQNATIKEKGFTNLR